ncbi:hypothetical protein D3C87_1670280 [compost metagenome]
MTGGGNQFFNNGLAMSFSGLYLGQHAWVTGSGLIICFYKWASSKLSDLLAFDVVIKNGEQFIFWIGHLIYGCLQAAMPALMRALNISNQQISLCLEVFVQRCLGNIGLLYNLVNAGIAITLCIE